MTREVLHYMESTVTKTELNNTELHYRKDGLVVKALECRRCGFCSQLCHRHPVEARASHLICLSYELGTVIHHTEC